MFWRRKKKNDWIKANPILMIRDEFHNFKHWVDLKVEYKIRLETMDGEVKQATKTNKMIIEKQQINDIPVILSRIYERWIEGSLLIEENKAYVVNKVYEIEVIKTEEVN